LYREMQFVGVIHELPQRIKLIPKQPRGVM
jgi:hypothetical protein